MHLADGIDNEATEANMVIPLIKLNPYWVTSPEYGVLIPILDDGSGPIEYGCDVEEVWAPNKRDAIKIAVKKWRTERGWWSNRNYVHDRMADGLNPFVGIKAELAMCGHGVVTFYECKECDDEWTKHQSQQS